MVRGLLVTLHLAVERQCPVTVTRQFLSQFRRAASPRSIDDGRTIGISHQRSQLCIFVLVGVSVYHAVVQVGSCGCRGKDVQIQIKCLLEIVADVLDDLLLGSCREARNGNLVSAAFLFLVVADEFTDVEIVHAEVLSPGRETMGFVNHKPHHMALQQDMLNGVGTQHLRGDIQQRRPSVLNPLYGQCSADGVQQSVDGHSICDTAVCQTVHLVFHQRLQGRDDYRQPMQRPALHQGRQLEGETLAATRREYGQKRPAFYSSLCRLFLQVLSLESPELLVAKVCFQVVVRVQLGVAIGTSHSRAMLAYP